MAVTILPLYFDDLVRLGAFEMLQFTQPSVKGDSCSGFLIMRPPFFDEPYSFARRNPSLSRITFGMVICPLEVTFAVTITSPCKELFPYFIVRKIQHVVNDPLKYFPKNKKGDAATTATRGLRLRRKSANVGSGYWFSPSPSPSPASGEGARSSKAHSPREEDQDELSSA